MDFEAWLKKNGKDLEFNERQSAAKGWYACREECLKIIKKKYRKEDDPYDKGTIESNMALDDIIDSIEKLI